MYKQKRIKWTRSLMGKTNPNDSKPGTIRGDLRFINGYKYMSWIRFN